MYAFLDTIVTDTYQQYVHQTIKTKQEVLRLNTQLFMLAIPFLRGETIGFYSKCVAVAEYTALFHSV